MKPILLESNLIFIDYDLYPRNHVNYESIKTYAQDMKKGDEFPPVIVGIIDKKYYLCDGLHRFLAHQSLGKNVIRCEILENIHDKKGFFIASVKANLKHGIRYNKNDRDIILKKFLDMSLSKEEIKNIIHIPEKRIIRKTIHNAQTELSKKFPSIKENVNSEINTNILSISEELESFLLFLKDNFHKLKFKDNRAKLAIIKIQIEEIIK